MNTVPMPSAFRLADTGAIDITIEPDFRFDSQEYQSLHRRSRSSAFQNSLWLATLYATVAPASAATALIIAMREKGTGRLLLLLPLVCRRRGALRFIEFCDFGLCDYLGAVYDPNDLPLLMADTSLAGRVADLLPNYDLVALTKLFGQDPILDHLFPKTQKARMRLSTFPMAIGTDWAQWRSHVLDQSFQRYLGRKRRRLEKAGTPKFAEVLDPDEIGRLFSVLRRFRSDRFSQLGVKDIMDDEAVFSFYRQVAIAGAASGTARTYCQYLSGEPVAILFGLVRNKTFSMIAEGYDLVRYSNFSLGLLIIEDSLRDSVERGDLTYDFTIGDHAYKVQFGAAPLPLYEWHAARTIPGRICLLGIKAVREAKRLLKPLVSRNDASGSVP